MRIPRFYCEVSLHDRKTLCLKGQPAHHLMRVLRRNIDDPICLFDGHGGEYHATVKQTQRNSVELSIDSYSSDNHESPLQTHLGLALSKGERMDWAIQKCTELGINTITPLLTQRCDVKLHGERQERKIEHWQRVACSACEQCGRNRIPLIASAVRLTDWLNSIDVDLSLVCHSEGSPMTSAAVDNDSVPKTLALLVGPEGGLTNDEIQIAQRAGFHLTRFGPRTLRTETAPVAVLSIAQFLWGDLNAR